MTVQKLEEITGELCDKYCRYPGIYSTEDKQDALDEICKKCPMNGLFELLDDINKAERKTDCHNGQSRTPVPTTLWATNYDRIMNMSLNQMAEFMREMLDCISCQNKMMNNGNPLGEKRCNDNDFYKMCNGDYRKCLKVCKEWLKSEVKENAR